MKNAMKRWICYICVLLSFSLINSCSLIPEEKMSKEEVIKPVKVKTMKKENKDVVLDYLGAIRKVGQKYIVAVELISKDIEKVKVGTQATIQVDNDQYKGKIINISSIPDKEKRTFAVQIELQKVDIDIKDFDKKVASIKLIIGQEEGFFVDIKDVFKEKDTFVYMVDNDKVVFKPVTIKYFYNTILKVEGLKEGDKIITLGKIGLKEGQKVKIIS